MINVGNAARTGNDLPFVGTRKVNSWEKLRTVGCVEATLEKMFFESVSLSNTLVSCKSDLWTPVASLLKSNNE